VGVQDVSDLIAVMKEHAQHEYDGGITAQGNPYAEIWQPEEGACVRFAAESGN